MPKLITSTSLSKKLIEAGIIPPNTRRAIIDIRMNDAVTIYIEAYGDERLLDIIANNLEGAKIVMAGKPECDKIEVTTLADTNTVYMPGSRQG